MELIKKIKQAEDQAQQIIEQAKAQTARQAEESRQRRRQIEEAAQLQRKKATAEAVAQAEVQAKQEAENLKARAQGQRQELHNKADSKMAGAVAKVMNHLGVNFAESPQNPVSCLRD
jgi:V/A-type H+-transporting ATPase subunit G/H